MRDILFQGKRTDNNEWMQGYLIMSSDDKAYIKKPIPDVNFLSDCSDMYEVYSDSVGQYIGRKDMHENMIFEGNLIETPDLDEEDGYGVVIYDNDSARFVISCQNVIYDFDCYYHYEIEVIGNDFDREVN